MGVSLGRVRAATRSSIMLAAAAALAGCSLFDNEEVLEGTRIPVRGAAQESTIAAGASGLPAERTLDAWTHVNGHPTHNSGHLAGPTGLARAWSVDAGTGGSDRSAITAAPVVAEGAIFSLDAAATVHAFDAGSGARRWETDLAPESENGEEGFGGGLAIAGGRLFATTGFGEVVALEPASGEVVWRTKLGATVRAAPAAADGVVIAVTRDNQAFGLDAATGAILWRLQGASSAAGVLGGASPALAPGLVVIPYASGEIVGADPRTGRRAWTAALSGGRRGLARSSISDVSGDPVIVGPLVVAASQAGRMVAIDGRNGARVWTRSIGSVRPIWAAGDAIFLVSDDMKLMRLAAQNGATVWETPLPAFEDEEDREDPIGYSGPIVVSGRVLLTDTLGQMHVFDAATGVGTATEVISGGSVTGPVVVGGLLYVLSDGGELIAFR